MLNRHPGESENRRTGEPANWLTNTGFTLVEMLLVAAILSVLGLTLGAAVNNGVNIWNTINGVSFDGDIAIFFDKIAFDIRNTMDYQGIDFYGEKELLSLPVFVIASDGKPLPGRRTYRMGKKGSTIERKEEDFYQLYEEKGSAYKTVLDNIEHCEFIYYVYDKDMKEYLWVEEIKETKPVAVRVKAGIKDNAGKVHVYTRTIDIPVAKIEPEAF